MNGGEGKDGAAKWFRDWLPLIMLVVAGLVWGLKLESNLAILSAEVSSLRQTVGVIDGQIARGTLPRTEERLAAIGERLYRLERDCEKPRK